jgi:hypothetical protein
MVGNGVNNCTNIFNLQIAVVVSVVAMALRILLLSAQAKAVTPQIPVPCMTVEMAEQAVPVVLDMLQ